MKTIYKQSPEIADEVSYTCCALQWTKDPDARETKLEYDDSGYLTHAWTDSSGQSETQPLVRFTYDSFGNLANETTYSDADNPRQRSYAYDNNRRVIRIDRQTPLGYEEFGYDDAGSLLWKRDGNGAFTLLRYDDLNRLIDVYYNYTGSRPPTSYPGTADVTYTYDGGSRLVDTVTDPAGTYSYNYDERDRITSYTPPKPTNQGAVTYGYNNLNQKTSVSVDAITVNYTYYANGWLKDVKRGSTLIAGYTYDYVGNRTRVDYGNSTYQTFGYESGDPRYQLNMIEYAYRCAAGQAVAVQGSLRLTSDNAGNPLTWCAYDTSTPAVGVYGKNYTYDVNSRLDTVSYPGLTPVDYSYDWVGNRTGPGGLAFNDADQLTSWPGHHAYDYTGNGNLHHQFASNGTTVQKTYAYNCANLVSSVTHAGVTLESQMTWDAAGNRVEFKASTRTNDTDTYGFVNDVTVGLPAVIKEVGPTGSTVYYIREPNGALIARVTGSGESQTTYYYHFDELGSTLFMTTDNGTVSDRYTYDAWGNVISHTGSTKQPYQYVGLLGYYTHYQDVNLPLLQLGLRLYDPETGRFTQRDPMESGENDYEYCGSSPISAVDPTGLVPWSSKMCWDLFGKIARQTLELSTKLDDYDPVSDYYGWGFYKPKGSNKWKQCEKKSHYRDIQRRADGLRENIELYNDKCNGRGNNPKVAKRAWDIIRDAKSKEKPHPIPFWPFIPIPYTKVPCLNRVYQLGEPAAASFPFIIIVDEKMLYGNLDGCPMRSRG